MSFRRKQLRRSWVGFVALACLLSSCATGSLQFRNDHRLEITAPKRQAKVTEPLTVRWTMRDAEPGNQFVVFVDRAPMKVGKKLSSLANDPKSCAHDLRCPTAEELAPKGIYVTTGNEITIEILPNVSKGVGDEQHFIYVVLVDESGTRRTESAWYTTFKRERRG